MTRQRHENPSTVPDPQPRERWISFDGKRCQILDVTKTEVLMKPLYGEGLPVLYTLDGFKCGWRPLVEQ